MAEIIESVASALGYECECRKRKSPQEKKKVLDNAVHAELARRELEAGGVGGTSGQEEKYSGVGYVDGCFDLMHSGHMNAIRQAYNQCDKLVVGIHSDDEILKNKGPPVMNQKERYEFLKHLKWCEGGLVYDMPYTPALATLDRAGADFCFHGDDMPLNSEGQCAYDPMKKAGRLRIVKRTEGVSTTDLIGRLMTMTKKHLREAPALTQRDMLALAPSGTPREHLPKLGASPSRWGAGARNGDANGGDGGASPAGGDATPLAEFLQPAEEFLASAAEVVAQPQKCGTPVNQGGGKKAEAQAEDVNQKLAGLSKQGIKFLTTARRIAEFSKGNRSMTKDDKVVYMDGSFDLFHVGHATALAKAKALGTFLVVGVYDDATTQAMKGANYPIVNLHERVLCISACKHVDEVVLGAPLSISQDMINSLKINVVAVGDHTMKNYHRRAGYSIDYKPDEAYAVPEKLGMLRTVSSDFPHLNTTAIAQRIADNKAAYEKRQSIRAPRESDYYKDKEFREEA